MFSVTVYTTLAKANVIITRRLPLPAADNAKRLIRADGVKVATLLEAVLPFFPLDGFVEKPVITMDCSPWGDEPESYERFRSIIKKHHESFTDFELEERFALYKRAQKAYAVVVTSEPDGNIILKKGPVMM